MFSCVFDLTPVLTVLAQLGVPSNASQQEIRRAYFQKSRWDIPRPPYACLYCDRQCHPDKTTEADAKAIDCLVPRAKCRLGGAVPGRVRGARALRAPVALEACDIS